MKRKVASLLLCALLAAPFGLSSPAARAAEVGSLQVLAAPLQSETAATDGTIRVWLSSVRNQTTFNLTVSGSYTFGGTTLANGSTVKVEFSGGTVYVTAGGMRLNMGNSVTFTRISGGMKIAESLAPGNVYPGELRFFYSGGVSYAVCALDIESYVYGVLPYEMDNDFPLEALKAQAIAARTFGIRAKTSGGAYDVTDTISHQIFRGVNSSKTRCIQAADETKGVVLTYGGSLIDANFSASNGGQTELNSNAWGTARAGYYTMQDDPFDLANPQSSAKSYLIYSTPQAGASTSAYTMIQQALASRLGGVAASYTINEITDVTVHTPKHAAPSRLYTQLRVTLRYNSLATPTTVDIPIFPTVKTTLGLSINTTDNELFTVTKETGGFRVTARRYGHGVGLSQRGAQQMAGQGYTYQQIIGFYYPGTTLVRKNFTGGSGGSALPTAVPSAAPGTISSEGRVSLANPSSRLNLRQTPSLSGAVVARMPHGASVTVLKEEGTWYQVQYGTLVGYVAKEYIVRQQVADDSASTAYVAVQSGWLSMRAEARATAAIIGNVPNGAVVTVLSRDTTWALVLYEGVAGYVMAQYLSTTQDTGSAAATVYLVNASDVLPMRSNPSSAAAVLLQLQNGATVTVLEKGSAWSKVSIQGVIGYVMNEYLIFQSGVGQPGPTASPTPAPTAGQAATGTVTLTSGTLNLRSLPNTDSLRVTSIPNYAEVSVTQLGEVWCEVTYGGYSGYVMRRYLTLSAATPTAAPAATATPKPVIARAWVMTSIGGNVNLRMAPSIDGTILMTIPHGAELSVLEHDEAWTYASYGGYTGYVATQFLIFSEVTLTPTPAPSATAQPAGATVYVSTGSGGPVNLRRETSTKAAILDTLMHGTQVELLQTGSEWSLVRVNGQTGYIASQYLSQTAPTTPAVSQNTPPPTAVILNQGKVTLAEATAQLSLRSAGDAAASVTATLAHRAAVDVLQYVGSQAQWLYVRSGTATGYAPRESVTLYSSLAYAALSSLDGTLPVYTTAADTATVVTNLQQGALVTVIAYANAEWVQIRLSDGAAGYVRRANLQFL